MIEHLVARINADLNWGKVSSWTNKDFECLSERIWDKTQKRLSVTTLKRIWGRAETGSQPSQTTLDILAEFAGFDNWRSFTQGQEVIPSKESSKSHVPFSRFAVLGLLLLGMGLTYFLWNREPEVAAIPPSEPIAEDFYFNKTVVADEIPNSVVFAYDVSSAAPQATIEIQQDWDMRKRLPLSREDSIATCIYYRPGHFKAKLVVDSQIVAEDDVLIPTENWLGVVEQEPIPVYLPDEVVNRGKDIAITSKALKPYNIDPMQQDIITCLYKVADFGALYTDDFTFNMEVRHTLDKPRRRCRGVQIYLIFNGSAISIPLANKGCVANLNVMTFEDFVSGKNADLSAFGVNMDEWQRIKMVSQHGTLEVFIDEQAVYQMPVPQPGLAINGISVYFEGTGTVREAQFRNSKGLDINL